MISPYINTDSSGIKAAVGDPDHSNTFSGVGVWGSQSVVLRTPAVSVSDVCVSFSQRGDSWTATCPVRPPWRCGVFSQWKDGQNTSLCSLIRAGVELDVLYSLRDL